MGTFSRIGLILGALFVIDSFVYLALQHDKQGFTLILFAGLGFAYLGLYALLSVRKARRQAAAEGEELGEPHIGPTIWPFVFAVSAVVITIGILVTPVILVLGGILFVVAAVGWIAAARRQWHVEGHDGGDHGTPAPTVEH